MSAAFVAKHLQRSCRRVEHIIRFPFRNTPITLINGYSNSCRLFELSKSSSNVALVSSALVIAGGLASMSNSNSSNCDFLQKRDSVLPQRVFEEGFQVKKMLGCGSFGIVQHCINLKTGANAAVKVIPHSGEYIDEVERERNALQLVKSVGGHSNIIQLDQAFCDDSFLYVVTELVQGETLHSYINKKRRLSEHSTLAIAKSLAHAFQFLHSNKIIHRDVKPENIMVTGTNAEAIDIKVLDFGSSKVGDNDDYSDVSDNFIVSGTRAYWSPEMLERNECSSAMDMWAIGCILYILVAGVHPFDPNGILSEEDMAKRIMNGSVRFNQAVWRDVSPELKDLISGLLNPSPTARLTAVDMLKHPFLS